jgi:diguanylate cyclase (GGDEF)-like protein
MAIRPVKAQDRSRPPPAARRRARSGPWAAPALALLACVSALLPGCARGANVSDMVFARLDSNEGLSQGAVMAIAQDGQGFLWFGTEDGLDRFDGYELRHFIHGRNDAGTLPNNWIAALARDASGRLWVGSDGGGLVWRDRVPGQFRPPLTSSGQALLDPSAKIRTLYVDRSQRIWVATRDAGIRVLDPVRGTSKEFRRDRTNQNALSDDSVFAFAEDGSDKMWVGTESGLDRLDPESGQVEQFGGRLRAAGVPQTEPVKVNALHADSRGTLWIGLDSGVARFDVAAGSMTVIRNRHGDPGALPEGRVTAFLEDDEQRLWVGTSTGLALLDRRTDRAIVFRHEPTNPASLPDSYVISLYQDRSGLLWVGTKTGGVARWNPRSWSFGHRRFGEDGADTVTSFAVDRHGALWVGSWGGVATIDPNSGAVKRYRRAPSSPLVLRDENVMAIVTDDQNRVWLGTMGSGVERLDPARGEVAHFGHVPGDPSSLPAPGVMSLLRDARGRIWVGTYGGGLARIDPDSGRVVSYPSGRRDASGLSGNRATALAEDPTGLIWIGTDGGGLNVLDPESGRFAHFVHDPRDSASLAANTVYAVHIDDKGGAWIGTRGGGLDHAIGSPFGKEHVRFENLAESEGLPNNTVYGIESDVAGRLWVSTNRGLAVVRPQDRTVRGFRRSHGLQGDEFNFGAHYRAPDGTLYFGGANGYNAFLPERLRFNDKPPPVVLTDVLKLNTPVSRTPEVLDHLDLGFRDAVVTFRFAALDFTGPAENRYAYRLEGFDADWVKAGNGRQATYTNLAGGAYVFRVRAANSDGLWSEQPLALRVRVAPPPWATWWARTLYGLGIGGVIFFVWFSQQRRLKSEAAYAARLKADVEARTTELAARNQDMERANLQLREASVTDSLTGLGNRRCLREAMAAMFGPAGQESSGAAATHCVLMIVDLDYLKPINDQYGHEGGDAVLLQITQILRRLFRSVDLIVRWGGDEFVVLCRNADLATASALAERVRSSVAKQIFRVGEGLVARTSVSIGFAPVPFIPGHLGLLGWEQSMNLADVALYEAKRDRNTWVGWGGTEKAAELPSVPAAIAADHAALERDGFLIVRRRPWSAEDTVDEMRAMRRPGTQ